MDGPLPEIHTFCSNKWISFPKRRVNDLWNKCLVWSTCETISSCLHCFLCTSESVLHYILSMYIPNLLNFRILACKIDGSGITQEFFKYQDYRRRRLMICFFSYNVRVLFCQDFITRRFTTRPPPHCVLNRVLRGHFLGTKMLQWNKSLRSFMSIFCSFWSPCLTPSERDVGK